MIIICTPIPVDSVFGTDYVPSKEFLETKFGFLEGIQSINGFEISRIISTDPRSYLNSDISPGSILKQ